MKNAAHTALSLLACLLVALSAVALSAPQAADPTWSKVPALPTSCYSGPDPFSKSIDTAIETLTVDLKKQQDIDTQATTGLASMDPAEKKSKMMALMAANPQDAMKLVQAMQAMGTTANAQASSGDLANKTKLESDLESLIAKYRAAHRTSSEPFEAKVKALNPTGVGEGGVAIPPELIKKGNADYERLCGEWWSASGPFHAWLKQYKDYLIQVEIPLHEKLAEGVTSQLTAFGITAPYRSTATMEAVLEYMRAARRIFVERSGNPITDKM
jgi:hypothetical protein